MAITPSRTGHDERTSSEPRSSSLHPVTISRITQVNRNIKTFQLTSKHAINFKPGQWLDVFLPGLPKPGGFTITSAPIKASKSSSATVELAIQRSPVNPAAAWLWQEQSLIEHHEINVRVGGSFVWPPDCYSTIEADGERKIQHVLFVAGGVGINPLVSMVRHFMATGEWPAKVTFLYGSRVTADEEGKAEEVLFLKDLVDAERVADGRMKIKLFLTGEVDAGTRIGHEVERRRISEADLIQAIKGNEERTVCFVCGVPTMTDGIVKFLSSRDGVHPDRVLCEKWW